MTNRIKHIIKNPTLLFLTLGHRGFLNWMSDEQYLKIAYKIRMDRKLDLDYPCSFNEKLQWLKLYDRRSEYTYMVDKYEAKKYVSEKIGEEYIVPSLGVWDRFDDINFDLLPNQFVLKCTHDSGGIVICDNKRKLSITKARKIINGCLKHNYFWGMREWPYKNVKPRIIAEKYMVNTSYGELECNEHEEVKGLTDYKFYCFNGEPKFLYVSKGLENHATAQISFLTLDWKFAKFKRSDYKPFNELPKKPSQYEKMLKLANNLSSNIPFLRVDLYQIEEQVYFSEMTFSPCSGMIPFEPMDSDLEIGKLLNIDTKQQEYVRDN